jgi:monofunctional biosynthetic peptidoglycan transglycosylase
MIKRLFKILLKALLWFAVISVLWVVVYKFIPVPFTPLMAIRYFEADQKTEIKHQWKSLEEISPYLQLAVICSEDQHFVKHNGFDVKSIKKAYKSNKKGQKLRGGSTISQQTAKNVFLWPQRSWLRKGLETWFTFLIETIWSKERILEVYLNSIEMGEGVYGAEAASNYWFNKSALQLTTDNAAALASILPNPRKYRAHPPTNFIRNRIYWVKNQMQNYGTFTLIESAE